MTYIRPEDALSAIRFVNNIQVDGRTIKVSLGTTKYCSHFLKGTQCMKTVRKAGVVISPLFFFPEVQFSDEYVDIRTITLMPLSLWLSKDDSLLLKCGSCDVKCYMSVFGKIL